MHPNLEDKNSPCSLSFNRFYNANLADVAARVTGEFESADDEDFVSCDDLETVYEDEDDFEFSLPELVLAEGEIRPVYPVFDRDLMRDFNLVGEIESGPLNQEEECSRAQNQLKNLFLENRGGDPPSSSSSSDADDLERSPAGTYCVWAPNKSPSASPSPGRCTKSSSTGSSATENPKLKLWKLRDLLKRSKSDGKDGGRRRMMLLTPKNKQAETPPAGRSSNPSGAVKETAARERRYSGGGMEKNRRRSYLPYKQDLVGFFVTPQALRKSHLPHFP